MTTYAIVDVANLFHRARHAVQADSFTKAGLTLNIIFRSLNRLYTDFNADHIVVCAEGRSWRYDVYPEYKIGNRMKRMNLKENDKEEDALFFDTMNEFIRFMKEESRCTVLQANGAEGDDFIARWTQLHPDDKHIILSGDNDFVQLLSDNVSIYNGMDKYHITNKGVFNEKGQEMFFSIQPKDGKVKVKNTVEEARKAHDKEEKEKKKLDPTYNIVPFEFVKEDEWWRKALFIKIIRGDTSDSIMSAFPGIRYKGSKKTIGIEAAWEDSKGKGIVWNNFMLQTWPKAIYGQEEAENVLVRDEYKFNESLIDLTQQPDRIKELMDSTILEAVSKEKIPMVGINFKKFCSKHELVNLSKEFQIHSQYLGAGYGSN